LQHLARRRLLDDAVQLGLLVHPAELLPGRRRGRRLLLAEVPRHRPATDPRPRRHRPHPHHHVDLQRLHAVPADRRRAVLPDRAAVHLQLPRRLPRLRVRQGRRRRRHHHADQPLLRPRLPVDRAQEEAKAGAGMKLTLPQYFSRLGFSALAAILGALFALPLVWFLFAPFNARAELGIAIPDPFTLANFETVFGNAFALRGLLNSLIQSVGGVILVGIAATLAAYALSRSAIPGKGAVTYVLLLFSSVVSGSAAMVPIFLIISAIGL